MRTKTQQPSSLVLLEQCYRARAGKDSMAQSPVADVLLNGLVSSITGIPLKSSDPAHRKVRATASRAAKSQQYVRTNQFEVEARLDGLTEKFQILNRDDLANALQPRRSELAARGNKWVPELLSLLLELSDRPAEKTELEDLDGVRQPALTSSELTWAEIIADDPFTDEELWRDVSFSHSSSEDEGPAASSPRRRRKEMHQRIEEQPYEAPLTSELVMPVDTALLSQLQRDQFWHAKPKQYGSIRDSESRFISEFQIIHEVVAMLRGLATSSFATQAHQVIFVGELHLTGVSAQELKATMDDFAARGSLILSLRTHTRSGTAAPVLQTFQAELENLLGVFWRSLDEFVDPRREETSTSVVSLQRLAAHIDKMMLPIERGCTMVSALPNAYGPIDCLEALYKHACDSQAIGERSAFDSLVKILFACLQTYLRPIQLWMEEGVLRSSDEGFFITMSEQPKDLARLWHDVYSLRLDEDDRILAPSFFHAAGKSILNAGKSVIFLRRLGINSGLENFAETPELDLETVCGDETARQFVPFSEALAAWLETWIQSKYGPASSILRQTLLSDCGVERYLDSLAYIYFSRDGILFQDFADQLFRRLDGKQQNWDDRFLLTELAQRVFAAHIDTARLSVKNTSTTSNRRSISGLSKIKIDVSIPWPVLNIIQRPSLPMYQRVFCFLLQIYRAKYLLRLENAMIRHFGADKATVQLKQQLTWFVDNMQTYTLETVITPAVSRLRERNAAAEDVDMLINIHESAVTSIERQCLLARNLKPIHDALIALLELAVEYHDIRAAHLRSRDEASILDERSRKTRQRRPRQNGPSEGDDQDSESSEDQSEDDADEEDRGSSSDGYEERLVQISKQFTQLCNFAVAGLRGVSRAGGELCWEMLAERLQWGLPPT